MDHNPFLAPWRRPQPNQVAGKGRIEEPEAVENIEWQTRPSPPSDYENDLADALIACFEAGIEDLDALVECLNGKGIHGPDGRPWTADSFGREMTRLGS